MVARVCQLVSFDCSSVLFRFFFRFYTQWMAKHNGVSPIFITEALKPDLPRIPGMHETWDSARESCRDEVLPVLNPAFPHANTCHTVGRSGLWWFYQELSRMHLQLSSPSNVGQSSMPWLPCYVPYCIGDDFAQFLVVEICSSPNEVVKGGPHHEQWRDFYVWSGLVESRLRLLLYAVEEQCTTRAHPEQLQNPTSCTPCHWFAFGVKSKIDPDEVLSLSFFARAIEEFKYSVQQAQLQGAVPFARKHATMLEPNVFLVHQTSGLHKLPDALHPREVEATESSSSSRKRSRLTCEDAAGFDVK